MHFKPPDRTQGVFYCHNVFFKAQNQNSPLRHTGVKRKLNYLKHRKKINRLIIKPNFK